LNPVIYVIHHREDDPVKNTSLKMIKYGYAKLVVQREVKGEPVVLNPYSHTLLGSWHREKVIRYGIVVVDASWKRLEPLKFNRIPGLHVKLPPLLPGNPVNYGKISMLSSIEAVAAALYITGFIDMYWRLIGLYKWMNTFHELNKEVLEEYRKAKTLDELIEVVKTYWGDTF